MTTTLTDLLPHFDDMMPATIEHWVAAALAEAAALRAYDNRLYPLTDRAEHMEAARRLHRARQRWADEADDLVRRARAKADRGQHVLGLDDLRFLLERARAIQQMPPEEMLRRHQRIQSGEAEVRTVEEVRRELGLAHRG